MYLGYATQRNTISVLIIVNKQFEKTGQNIGIGKKKYRYCIGIGISVKSRIGRAQVSQFSKRVTNYRLLNLTCVSSEITERVMLKQNFSISY
jgi:hypothetical protein